MEVGLFLSGDRALLGVYRALLSGVGALLSGNTAFLGQVCVNMYVWMCMFVCANMYVWQELDDTMSLAAKYRVSYSHI